MTIVAFETLERRQLLDGLPHPNDPVLQKEHLAVMALVPDSGMTHTVIQSGAWSDPATWSGAAVPTVDANVLIPVGLTATVDAVNAELLHTIRVDGTLKFAPASNTQLVVDTLIVTPTGSLIMGEADAPIASGVTSRILFGDNGPIDTHWDPNLFSRGLISHGTTSIFGEFKTPYAALEQPAARGATKLVFTDTPENWQVGDELVLTGTSATVNQDERLTILSINGAEVTVRALSFAHTPPSPDLHVYVANVTRNAILESQDKETISRRGHAMFMHNPKVNIHNAAFIGLGRTNKGIRINDPQLDADGHLIAGTGTNPRGRYGVHFHRTGIDHHVEPVHVSGSVVLNSPGWGYVNHSSNAVFEDNVAVDVTGAAFVTEAGDELGTYARNLAIRSIGAEGGIESRQDIQDFGFQGDGFWFQGGGVSVYDNIATGQRHAGFVFFTKGLIQPGLGTTKFPAHNLPNPAWAGDAAMIDVGAVPIRMFMHNTSYASGSGLETWFHLRDVKHTGRSVIENLTVWNARNTRAVFIPYTHNTTLRNVQARRNIGSPAGTAIGRNDVTKNIIYQNLDLRGWTIGIQMPLHGTNAVIGGTLQNVRNIEISDNVNVRSITITGVQFMPLPSTAANQYDIFMNTAVLLPADRDLPKVFADDTVRLNDSISVNGRQIYSHQQAANFVPYPSATAPTWVPSELRDKTNLYLWKVRGWSVGGAVAPPDATMIAEPRIFGGLVGSPRAPLPAITLNSKKYTRTLNNYRLVYTYNAVKITDPTPVNLAEGWNVITRTIGGRPRSFLVFGDITPPTFTVSPTLNLTINPLALSHGFTVRGTVSDNSTGDMNFSRMFNDLLSRPIQTRSDGSQFILLSFRITDRAGNFTDVALELTLSASAPM